MSGWKPCLIALGLLVSLGAPAEAQGVVPGGWSPQFGFQSFGGPAAAGYLGYGYGAAMPGYSPYGSGVMGPYLPAGRPSYNYYSPSSQSVMAIDPLIGAIRRSTGRRGSR
jgi:hypothetical protein